MGRRVPWEGVARRPREEEDGAIHHVYARGNRAVEIFLDDVDRRRYLRLLGDAVGRHGWRCLAYCLMTNHVHLAIETPRANLGSGLQLLRGAYARWFNLRHRLTGHLFQGRYGATRIGDDVQLITTLRYIEDNPVHAGLVAQPAQWSWSSARPPAPSWLAADRRRALVRGEDA